MLISIGPIRIYRFGILYKLYVNLHDFHSGSGANFNLGAREHDGENTCHPSKFHREEVQVPAEAQQ